MKVKREHKAEAGRREERGHREGKEGGERGEGEEAEGKVYFLSSIS